VPTLDEYSTPAVLVDHARLSANIRSMQAVCDAHGVELRPHIKTHKMVPVAREQLAAGARGLTCAKLGEAEAMLPSGVQSLFIAHSLVDVRIAPRLAAVAARVPDLRLAVTSEDQLAALERLVAVAGLRLRVMLAIDTGLGREGSRSADDARRVAKKIAGSSRLSLGGFYTHEGHFYGVPPAELPARAQALVAQICAIRDSIDPKLPVWPGCSVTARWMAETGKVQCVRPGAYVFGDLHLTHVCKVMRPEDAALTVLATVVDKPEPGLALIDAGSKTFSSDKTAEGVHGLVTDGRDLKVARVNEEHGYVRGRDVDALRIGDRLVIEPAHVCTVVNLTDEVVVTENGKFSALWSVDARGRTR
jgi:D-serine deaminase-like pyridoxal phosphate-dependent protein